MEQYPTDALFGRLQQFDQEIAGFKDTIDEEKKAWLTACRTKAADVYVAALKESLDTANLRLTDLTAQRERLTETLIAGQANNTGGILAHFPALISICLPVGRHVPYLSTVGPKATAGAASSGTPQRMQEGALSRFSFDDLLRDILTSEFASSLNITGGVNICEITNNICSNIVSDLGLRRALLTFMHHFKTEEIGPSCQQAVLLKSLEELGLQDLLDTSRAKRSRRVLGLPLIYKDVTRSIAQYTNKPDATGPMFSLVFEWKITHNQCAKQQFRALCIQAIERAFAFASNYAWLPSVDVFFVLSGANPCIGHILVRRDHQNRLSSTMAFFKDLTSFFETLMKARDRAGDVKRSACGAVVGALNWLKISPSMQRARHTTLDPNKHLYSLALAERVVNGRPPAVRTHNFQLCLKAVPLYDKEWKATVSTFTYEKNHIKQVFGEAAIENYDDVRVPYALVAVYRENGHTHVEVLHSEGQEMLDRLLLESRRLTQVEHEPNEYTDGSYASLGPLHKVDVPEGWGVLVMLHGATIYDTGNKTSACITLHSAITQRLPLGCALTELLDRIKRTLQLQLHCGKFISCDMRPPNVIAFSRALLDKAQFPADIADKLMTVVLEVSEEAEWPASGEASESDEILEEPSTEAELATFRASDTSFPCETGALVWTLIDYGFCIDKGGCTTIPEGAAWDLIKLVVEGDPGERSGLTMDPLAWSWMLALAICELQAAQFG
jgi:hypothetical protein